MAESNESVRLPGPILGAGPNKIPSLNVAKDILVDYKSVLA
jgi:hypothetical protein